MHVVGYIMAHPQCCYGNAKKQNRALYSSQHGSRIVQPVPSFCSCNKHPLSVIS